MLSSETNDYTIILTVFCQIVAAYYVDYPGYLFFFNLVMLWITNVYYFPSMYSRYLFTSISRIPYFTLGTFFEKIHSSLLLYPNIAGILLMTLSSVFTEEDATNDSLSCIFTVSNVCLLTIIYSIHRKSEIKNLNVIAEEKRSKILEKTNFIKLYSHTSKQCISQLLPQMDKIQEIIRKVSKDKKDNELLDISFTYMNQTILNITNFIYLQEILGNNVGQEFINRTIDMKAMIDHLRNVIVKEACLLNEIKIGVLQEENNIPDYCTGDKFLIQCLLENIIFGMSKINKFDMVFRVFYDKEKCNFCFVFEETLSNFIVENIQPYEVTKNEIPLFISKNLVEKGLGGSIQFWDRPMQEGLGVQVIIPLSSLEVSTPKRTDTKTKSSETIKEKSMKKGLKILIAEDIVLIRMSYEMAIKKAGEEDLCKHEFVSCKTGLEAYKAVKNGFQPDIVLTDLNMPTMNGDVLIQKLVEEKLISPNCRIYLLSGASIENKDEYKKRFYFDEILSKPVYPKEIKARINFVQDEKKKKKKIRKNRAKYSPRKNKSVRKRKTNNNNKYKKEEEEEEETPIEETEETKLMEMEKENSRTLVVGVIGVLGFFVYSQNLELFLILMILHLGFYFLVRPLLLRFLKYSTTISKLYQQLIFDNLRISTTAVFLLPSLYDSAYMTYNGFCVNLDNSISVVISSIGLFIYILFFKFVVSDRFQLEVGKYVDVVSVRLVLFVMVIFQQGRSSQQVSESKRKKEEIKEILINNLIAVENDLKEVIFDSSIAVRSPFFKFEEAIRELLFNHRKKSKLSRNEINEFNVLFQSLNCLKKDNLNLFISSTSLFGKERIIRILSPKKERKNRIMMKMYDDDYEEDDFEEDNYNNKIKIKSLHEIVNNILEEQITCYKSTINTLGIEENNEIKITSTLGKELEDVGESNCNICRNCLSVIFSNVLHNSFQFTNRGKISIDCYMRVNNDAGDLFFFFEVVDTGIGITADEVIRINKKIEINENENNESFTVIDERRVLEGEERGNPKLGIGLLCCKEVLRRGCFCNGFERDIVISSDGENMGTKVLFSCDMNCFLRENGDDEENGCIYSGWR